MNVVLFLGAGFSRAVNLPVMREFFGAVTKTDELTDDDKQFVRNLRQLARDGASMLQGDRDNLEHVLSFALMTAEFEEKQSDKPNSGEQLKLILQQVYRKIDLQSSTRLRKWLQVLLNMEGGKPCNYQLTVLTTNYDLVAEFGLWSIGLRTRLPIEWQHYKEENAERDSLYSIDGNGPLLCKLHGSLNWFEGASESSSFGVEATVSQVQGPDLASERPWYLPLICTGNYLRENPTPPPLIVPPTLYKQDAREQFQVIWQSAHKALERADRICIIGYSFPESDTHMKYFLASALAKNIDLPRIDIIDPEATNIVERLRRTDFGIDFKQMLNPVVSTWEKSRYQVT